MEATHLVLVVVAVASAGRTLCAESTERAAYQAAFWQLAVVTRNHEVEEGCGMFVTSD